MPRITYINPDGSRSELDVAVGTSVMQAAMANGLSGIVADCGGALACATCHVVVEDEAYAAVLPPVSEMEDEMLEFAAMERTPASRLSCQLVATEEMDGMTVRIAEPQV